MKTASKFVEQALKWKGKKESDGTHKEIIDIYNSQNGLPRGYKMSYKDSWCATFVSAVSIKLNYIDIIPPECSCEKMIELHKKNETFIENENRVPNVGDICFYDWQDNGKGDNKGWSDHVGIVTNVSRETFTVIEGNYGDAVKERTMKINAKNLRGFAVPKYDTEPSKTIGSSDAIELLAKEVIGGKWGNGSERYERIRKATQKRVNEILKG